MRQLPERFFLVLLLFLGLPFFESAGSLRPKHGFEFREEARGEEKQSLLIPEIEEEREVEEDHEEGSGSSGSVWNTRLKHISILRFPVSVQREIHLPFFFSDGRFLLRLFCILRL